MTSGTESFKARFGQLAKSLNETKETHETWDRLAKHLLDIKVLCTQELGSQEFFVAEISKVIESLSTFIISDRTGLSRSAFDLTMHLVEILKQKFAVFVDFICPAVSKALGKSNVLYRNRGFDCISLMIREIRAPSMVRHVCEASAAKSCIARPYGIKLFGELITNYPVSILTSKHKLIEAALIKGLEEREIEVRKVAQSSFQAFISKVPDRKDELIGCTPKDKLKFLTAGSPAVKTPPSQFPSSSSTSSFGSRTSREIKINHDLPNINSAKPRVYDANKVTKPTTSQKSNHVVFHKIPDFSQVKSKINTGRSNSIPQAKVSSLKASNSIPQAKVSSLKASNSIPQARVSSLKSSNPITKAKASSPRASNGPYGRPQAPIKKTSDTKKADHDSSNLPKSAIQTPAITTKSSSVPVVLAQRKPNFKSLTDNIPLDLAPKNRSQISPSLINPCSMLPQSSKVTLSRGDMSSPKEKIGDTVSKANKRESSPIEERRTKAIKLSDSSLHVKSDLSFDSNLVFPPLHRKAALSPMNLLNSSLTSTPKTHLAQNPRLAESANPTRPAVSPNEKYRKLYKEMALPSSYHKN